MKDLKAQQDAREFAAKALRDTHPHLVSAEGNALIAAAKNIRIELKRAFPGVKFKVVTSRFAGGDSINVSWTDGPMAAQVEPIANKYEGGSFDGMTDSYNYERSAWKDAFGDAKFISCRRDYSEATIAAVLRRVKTAYYPEAEASVDDYQMGRLWTVGSHDHHWNLQALVSRALEKHTFCLNREVA